MQKFWEALELLKRNLVDGTIITGIVTVFVIAPVLLDALTFVGMVVTSSIQKAWAIGGSMMKTLRSSPLPWLILLPPSILTWEATRQIFSGL